MKEIRASRSKEFQKHDSPSGLVKYPQVGVAVAADWRTTARILSARAPAALRAATARFSLRCGSVVVVATALTPCRLFESVAILHAVFVSSLISCATQQSKFNTSPSFSSNSTCLFYTPVVLRFASILHILSLRSNDNTVTIRVCAYTYYRGRLITTATNIAPSTHSIIESLTHSRYDVT